MINKNNNKPLYSCLLLLAFCILFLSFVINPAFIADKFSSDGILSKLTISKIYLIKFLIIVCGLIIIYSTFIRMPKHGYAKIIAEKIIDYTKEKEVIFGCCAAFLGATVIAIFSIKRNFFGVGAETDYLAKSIIEASRVLEGKPLQLPYHPPFYSIIVAAVQFFVRDWLNTGLFISWASSLVVLITSFVFFYYLCGRYAAWGSLAGLMSSSLFLTYSASATSDVFFLALYSLCFFLSILAVKKASNKLWVLTGAAVGFALLTRSNSLTLLLVLAFPLALGRTGRACLQDFARVFLACLLILGIWGVTAKLTGSRLIPQRSQVGLAQTFYQGEGDPFSRESRRELLEKFPNVRAVLTYDPSHMATTYVRKFFSMLKRLFRPHDLLAFPLNLLALPGVFLFSLNPLAVSQFCSSSLPCAKSL
jgi:hypothetical protein